MLLEKEFRQLLFMEPLTTELHLLRVMSLLMILTAVGVLFMLLFLSAPYGRYTSASWGLLINARLAWFVQEIPSFAIPFACLANAYWKNQLVLDAPTACLLFYTVHYFQRSLIYPFLIRGGKPTPFIPFSLALVFCTYNGIMQTRYHLVFSPLRSEPFTEPHFLAGSLIFLFGMCVNLHSDSILRNLRKPGETAYKIPVGGMFTFISGANFFGEIVEWGGFALASWSLPGLAFFIFTLFNIGPRAVSHHRWYLKKFDNYPRDRKALIPFVF